MAKPEDGGPAFPVESIGFNNPHPGMSLRDWFAGQALVAIAKDYGNFYADATIAANTAYMLANAMLAASKAT